jgi:hypothetical protein
MYMYMYSIYMCAYYPHVSLIFWKMSCHQSEIFEAGGLSEGALHVLRHGTLRGQGGLPTRMPNLGPASRHMCAWCSCRDDIGCKFTERVIILELLYMFRHRMT